MTDDLASVFEAEYLQPDSAVEAEVLREVFGVDYPDGLAINSFVSRTELARIVEAVAAAGLACGLRLPPVRGLSA